MILEVDEKNPAAMSPLLDLLHPHANLTIYIPVPNGAWVWWCGRGIGGAQPGVRSGRRWRTVGARHPETGGDGGQQAYDRPAWASCHLPPGVGDGPLRLPLRLLHVRAHDLPAQEGPAQPGGARSPVLRLRGPRGAEAAPHR